MGKGDKVKKEKEFIPEDHPWVIPEDHPWDTDKVTDVTRLYERIYSKAVELTKKDSKLWGLNTEGIRHISLLHIDNMLRLNGCKEWEDDGIKL
jgi:hypothetical protein